MPYKNPNTCISEKYLAQQDQAVLAARYNMTNGVFTLVTALAEDGVDTNDLDNLDNIGMEDVTMEDEPDIMTLAGALRLAAAEIAGRPITKEEEEQFRLGLG